MSSALIHQYWTREVPFEINETIQEASKVIVPYGPITAFAARHPWEKLEEETFANVARRFKEVVDVDILPSETVIQDALARGDIDTGHVEKLLNLWIRQQKIDLPFELQQAYCFHQLDRSTSSEKALPIQKELTQTLKPYLSSMKETVVNTASKQLERLGKGKIAKNLDKQMIKWSKLYLDDSQAVWRLPGKEEGFYKAWKQLIVHDPDIPAYVQMQLKDLPEEAELALYEAIRILEIPQNLVQGYLEAHLLALPGWSGMMLWRSEQSAKDASLLKEYLAVRITLEVAFMMPYLPIDLIKDNDTAELENIVRSWENWLNSHDWLALSEKEQQERIKLAYAFDSVTKQSIWLEAWERTYADKLKTHLQKGFRTKKEEAMPEAQFAFCIDVRSEPFRRALEKAGPFETFGTAGFFGLPIETCKLGEAKTHPSLPVMNKPSYRIKETAAEEAQKDYQSRLAAALSPYHTFKSMKLNLMSSVMLPDISGPWLAFKTMARSFLPSKTGVGIRKVASRLTNKPVTKLSLDRVSYADGELPTGFTEEEKVFYARQALQTMGLTENFSSLVVICGHASHSTNNPYASSLDCGACGGASSGFNARVLANLCNLPEVRAVLREEGIVIPEETVFIAAEHITTTDELKFMDIPELSGKAKIVFENIQTILPDVREEVNMRRTMELPSITSSNPIKETMRRAEDWSETRPEWGLAKNAAFIIGSRSISKHSNLHGRVFLHNYDWQKDTDGAILHSIISGPATVTQWINLQYYASTVAPHYYGSGNKTTQSVTSGIGVMQGNGSDLLTGLPWQSVMESDRALYHQPLRLLIVIQAPSSYVKRLLSNHPAFRKKVDNNWIHLVSMDADGNWIEWSSSQA
ncbi:DUF2309 domain-containing protein [Oceanobacillus piezotolerans]|uniref:Probable inorganic carbon transporter subunit DabA n=1 Tax=Oceanobacillus piezotolerans TaxID=2448030 RepID=A0A498DIX4_9BACI|nr:DUF2309 domain-containing protein [Oceanobacillus piezotolerans]RLL45455.1 DUF2309 domain-containing protein [Oceanobacillus piezotolerans]